MNNDNYDWLLQVPPPYLSEWEHSCSALEGQSLQALLTQCKQSERKENVFRLLFGGSLIVVMGVIMYWANEIRSIQFVISHRVEIGLGIGLLFMTIFILLNKKMKSLEYRCRGVRRRGETIINRFREDLMKLGHFQEPLTKEMLKPENIRERLIGFAVTLVMAEEKFKRMRLDESSTEALVTAGEIEINARHLFDQAWELAQRIKIPVGSKSWICAEAQRRLISK